MPMMMMQVSTAEAGKIGESMGDRNRRTAFNMAGVYGAMLVVPLLTISITVCAFQDIRVALHYLVAADSRQSINCVANYPRVWSTANCPGNGTDSVPGRQSRV